MRYTIVGLGNPGDAYAGSRHNVGRSILERLAEREDGIGEWKEDKKAQALASKGMLGGNDVTLVLPETFMNRSGRAASHFVKGAKSAELLIVVYDDMDLPLGRIRIAFGRSSGGHKGVDSIIRWVKTKNFIRIRVGVASSTPSGKLKKPKGEQKVLDFLMSPFKKPEQEVFKKVSGRVEEAIRVIVEEGRVVAMNQFN
jgi:PTH1 family peptidyl-tRNA hydrolase